MPKFAVVWVGLILSIEKRKPTHFPGMVRINFAPYTKTQLAEIVNARLRRAQEGATNVQPVIKPDAILYASTRVGGVSGDARRVLDICR